MGISDSEPLYGGEGVLNYLWVGFIMRQSVFCDKWIYKAISNERSVLLKGYVACHVSNWRILFKEITIFNTCGLRRYLKRLPIALLTFKMSLHFLVIFVLTNEHIYKK